jgi:NAD+ diphosphatase
MPTAKCAGGYRDGVIVFSGPALDRAPQLRRRPDWLEAQRADSSAGAVLMSDHGVWIDAGRLVLDRPGGDAIFLGLVDGVPLFAEWVEGAGSPRGGPAGLREAATELPAADAALAAYAGSLLAWHRRHRFCANCGAPTAMAEAGHVRRCPRCGAQHHPRTDPVVITLVHDGAERVLLGRQPTWPPGRYSTLAGFVEPGESLEEAVVREIGEEAAVAVTDVRYRSSQPWPFPASLMLGFEAAYAGGEAHPHDHELEDVRWVSRAELERAVAGEGPLLVPPPLAIARRLIEGWLARTA